MTASCEIMNSVSERLNKIEMKKFVDDGMFLQMKITLTICQKKNTSTTRTNDGSISIRPLRKRSDFKQALSTLECIHQEVGEEPFVPAQTMAVGIEFVLCMVEMARFLVVLLKIQKVKEEASKSLENER